MKTIEYIMEHPSFPAFMAFAFVVIPILLVPVLVSACEPPTAPEIVCGQ